MGNEISRSDEDKLDRRRFVGGDIYTELLDQIDTDADAVFVALTELFTLADTQKARDLVREAIEKHHATTRKIQRLRNFRQRGKEDE